MSKKLYVGNLGDDVDNSTLESLLSPHGTVENVNVITDRDNSKSKGYGFVEMSTEAEAQAAITALDGSEYNGRRQCSYLLRLNRGESSGAICDSLILQTMLSRRRNK